MQRRAEVALPNRRRLRSLRPSDTNALGHMRRPPNPFVYVTSEHTRKPGYLQKRMRMYREMVEREKKEREQIEAERRLKVKEFKKP